MTKNKYYSNTPVKYKGVNYPANDEDLLDRNGNIVRKRVFVDGKGRRYFINDDGSLTNVYQNAGMLPEVTITAPLTQRAVNRMYTRNLLDSLKNQGRIFDYANLQKELSDKTKQRQYVLNMSGYKNDIDGNWTLDQQNAWDSITTKRKDYPPSLTSLAEGLYDKVTGNDTYKANPLDRGEVRTYNEDNIDRVETAKMHSPALRAIWDTYVPGMTLGLGLGYGARFAANPRMTYNVARNGMAGFLRNPLPLIRKTSNSIVGGEIGSNIVDGGLYLTTGKNWNQTAQEFGAPPIITGYINPGDIIGGVLGAKYLLP